MYAIRFDKAAEKAIAKWKKSNPRNCGVYLMMSWSIPVQVLGILNRLSVVVILLGLDA